MGKKKTSLDELRKNLQTVKKRDMKNIRGGKGKASQGKNWNNGCRGIIPQ